MPSYMSNPQHKVTITHSGVNTDYINELFSAINIQRRENGYDVARLSFPDTESNYFLSKIATDDAIKIYAKDAADTSWTTLLNGIISLIRPSQGTEETTLIQCDGAGYGLGKTVCAQEYGSESKNSSLDTIDEIITDTTHGIVPKWVNKILGGTVDSGYAYTTDIGAQMADVMKFISFPYKPNDKCLNDLCELLTSLKARYYGPHWIVTPDNKLILKLTNNSATGWTKYYGDSQSAATLEQGIDFESCQFEKLSPEANHIIYYGAWRRPSNGDGWSENSASLWGYAPVDYCEVTNDSTKYAVGASSLKLRLTADWAGAIYIEFPSAQNAAWDFSLFGANQIPRLNFYFRRSHALISTFIVYLCTDADNYYYVNLSADLPAVDTWAHFSIPFGLYWRSGQKTSQNEWITVGSPNWNNINFVRFQTNGVSPYTDFHSNFDGVHFGGVPICRVAKNSTNITSYKLKTKVIIDDVGKDDTLKAADATGLIARMAYAELLRCQTTPLIGKMTIPMLKDLLPGQLLYVRAKKKADGTFAVDKDMRAGLVVHNISGDGYKTSLELTDDLINSHARTSYENINRVFANYARPEYQDRQASSIKAGTVDITIARLEKDYPS